ncbi:MAG: hypothetical protein WC718_10495 [Phycisphaerales bacterium]
MSIRVFVALAALAAAAAAQAQCSYVTSLLDNRDRIGLPAQGEQQQPTAAWTYHRSDQNRALLTGLFIGNTPAWGAPDQPFGVPLTGPRVSPNPLRNEIEFYRRTPSFEGVFFHPGYGTTDNLAIFNPGGNATLTGCTLNAEDLGTASPNVVVSVDLEVPGGTVHLIPPTSIVSLAAAATLSTPANQTYTLTAASRIVVRANNGGAPDEDWLNLNATLNVTGPAVILHSPDEATVCPGKTGVLSVVAAGATSYQWYRRDIAQPLNDTQIYTGATIAGSHTAQLSVIGAQAADRVHYYCVVSNACGSSTSTSALLNVLACCPDVNDDGNVDQGDIDYLINVVAGGPNPAAIDPDFNRDGNADQGDVDSLINVVAGGDCP